MRRLAVIATLVAVVFAGACGVSSEDQPQPIENSSVEQPPAIPSVESEPEPTPTAPPLTEPPSRLPTTSPAPTTGLRAPRFGHSPR